MVKLTALYKKPSDPQAFDRHYKETHIALVEKMPGLKKVELARVLGSPMGESEYYLLASMYFDDADSLKNAMTSPEGKAAAKDLNTFAAGLVQMMICDVNGN